MQTEDRGTMPIVLNGLCQVHSLWNVYFRITLFSFVLLFTCQKFIVVLIPSFFVYNKDTEVVT